MQYRPRHKKGIFILRIWLTLKIQICSQLDKKPRLGVKTRCLSSLYSCQDLNDSLENLIRLKCDPNFNKKMSNRLIVTIEKLNSMRVQLREIIAYLTIFEQHITSFEVKMI